MAPRVTALLNSYVHDRYVMEALGSVVTQASSRPVDIVILSPKSDFEVPPPLARAAEERGHSLRVVRIPVGPAGAGLMLGARAAQGDYLAVLDDDDLWEPGKIRWIETEVERTPGVGYLHNSQRFVDERNRPLFALNPHRLVRHPSSLLPEGREIVVDPRDPMSIARGMTLAPDFNNSSCVIDRSILLETSAALERVARGEDSFLFYSALLSGRRLALTSNRLTRYRLHAAASTAGESRGARGIAALDGYVAYASDHVDMIRLILDHLPDHALPEVPEWLAHEDAFWSTLRDVALREVRGPEALGRVRELLGRGSVRPRTREVYAALWGAWAILSPGLARAAFRAWRFAW